jgi:hypothetical protein
LSCFKKFGCEGEKGWQLPKREMKFLFLFLFVCSLELEQVCGKTQQTWEAEAGGT